MARPQKSKSVPTRLDLNTNQEFLLPGPSNQEFSLHEPLYKITPISPPTSIRISQPRTSQTKERTTRQFSELLSLDEEMEIENMLEYYLTVNPVTMHCICCISFNHLCKDCRKRVYVDEASQTFWNITKMKWEKPILNHTSIVRKLIQQVMERKTQNKFCTEAKFNFHIKTSCWACIWSEKALSMF